MLPFSGLVPSLRDSCSWTQGGGGGRPERRQFQPMPRKLLTRSETQSMRSVRDSGRLCQENEPDLCAKTRCLVLPLERCVPRPLCLSEQPVLAVDADFLCAPVVAARSAVPLAAITPAPSAPIEGSLLSIRLKSRLASLNIISVADHSIDHTDKSPIAKPTAGSGLRQVLMVEIEKYVMYAKTGYLRNVANLSALLGIIR